MTRRLAPVLGLAVLFGVAGIGVWSTIGTRGSADSRLDPSPDVVSTGADARDSGDPVQSGSEVSGGDSIPILRAAPPLEDLDGWLQSDIMSLDELRGSVVVLQFWTFGCINCRNTLPHLQALAGEHLGEPFEIVGVHSPEFPHEEDPAAVAEAAQDLGVTWPIALDTRQANFFGWQGSPAYWPRTYVIDQNGNIRFDHIGEGGYEDLGAVVGELLAGS